jgi:uncharacterized protein YndB with AHSA1/START domain
MSTESSADRPRLERTYDAPAELVWELLTTAAGLERWWAPDGFETRVDELDLKPGGHVRYTMTAVSPEQVAFIQNLGMPLANEFTRTFTEVSAPARLSYRSVIDFIPDHEPYDHVTTIDLEPDGDRTNLVMTMDPLHDAGWTQEYSAHRAAELDNLKAAIQNSR